MVIDTSIFIEFLRSRDKSNTRLAEVLGQPQLMVSALTVFELNMGVTSESKRQDVDAVLSGLEIIAFDRRISEKAGELYRYLKSNNQLIGVPDLLIAATALSLGQAIKTLNHAHFNRMPGLIVI
ncbi:MAG: type II toxin-antitoxin system VapC family toxin [Bacteroidia bacterium]|nr:type II toxin-antitoxin system VapC family toxin [Bacteroidia bacterium]